MITFAKAVTNGIIPMGGVIVTSEIYKTFMNGPDAAIEFAHGYTYSGHPMAAAVAHTVLDIMEEEGTNAAVRALEPILEEEIHALQDLKSVKDLRNIGLTAAIELNPLSDKSALRSVQLFERGLEEGVLLRVTGDTISFGPPFISIPDQIRGMIAQVRKVIIRCEKDF